MFLTLNTKCNDKRILRKFCKDFISLFFFYLLHFLFGRIIGYLFIGYFDYI